MELGLQGKIAIVVGAGADVGRATAISLAREGAKVVLVGRTGAALEETARMVHQVGGWSSIRVADLTVPAAADMMVNAVIDDVGTVDLLANTAGVFPLKGMDPAGPGPEYGSDETWVEAYDNVFMTAVRITRAIMPHFKEQQSGAIVHLGANSSRYYSSLTTQFGAMKAALVHAIKNWARDGGPHGVRVNGVNPGWIKGDNIERRVAEAALQAGIPVHEMEEQMVLGEQKTYWTPRMGLPEEYADAITFLLSERASYINGALLPVTGGSAAW